MKKQIKYVLIILLTTACKAKQKNKIEARQSITINNKISKKDTTKNFSKVEFASKRDTTCGMPISAGIEDTLVLKGKIYGFCAYGCKDDFIAILKKQHKR